MFEKDYSSVRQPYKNKFKNPESFRGLRLQYLFAYNY